MPTDHIPQPSVSLSRIALELDELVQQALAQDPFDEVGVSLAASMLASAVDELENALYLSDCLNKRSPAQLVRAAKQSRTSRVE